MGKPINSNVGRAETMPLNTTVNKEVFESFKDCLGEYAYPMNMILEIFMKQYSNGKFELKEDDILKFKNDGKEVGNLNTTFNKEICLEFKSVCKDKGYFIKNVITAFMEKYANGDLVLEYVDITKSKEN